MKHLLKNLDKLIEAPNGIEKLRETFFQLAIQGKLTEQNLKDEPATDLLKKIRSEKEKLIAEGIIRKQPELLPIKEGDKYFGLPKGWTWVRLIEYGDWGSGSTPNRSYPLYFDGTINWFKSGELTGNFISNSEEKITMLALKENSLRVNPKGSVLIAMYGATIGKVAILEEEGTTNQAVCACICSSYVFNEFLLLLLKSLKHNFIDQGAGAAQPNISRIKILNTVAPLPPFSEQKRIVEKVNELMRLIDELKRRNKERDNSKALLNSASLGRLIKSKTEKERKNNWQAISANFNLLYSVPENIEKLKQTILQLAVQGKLVEQNPEDEPASELLKKIKAEKDKLFSEGKIRKQPELPPIKEEEKPFELPKGWEWTRLECLGETQTGTTPPTNDSNNYGDFIPFVGPGDIYNFSINYNNNGLSKIGIEKGRLIRKNSVLMVCIGGSIGKAAINKVDVACNQQINAISLYLAEMTNYLFYSLISPYFQHLVVSKSSGSATPIINKQKWNNLVISLPPLSEQNRIVEKVTELMSLCDKLNQKLRLQKEEEEKLVKAVVNRIK